MNDEDNNNNNNNESLVLNEAPQDEQWGMEVGINAFLTSPVD
jgi:hypothetical protein